MINKKHYLLSLINEGRIQKKPLSYLWFGKQRIGASSWEKIAYLFILSDDVMYFLYQLFSCCNSIVSLNSSYNKDGRYDCFICILFCIRS